jgi:hypothetical protein
MYKIREFIVGFLTFFVLLVLSYPIRGQNFTKKVISDFDRHSFYILIKVESPKYNGDAIIENGALYYYFNQTQNIEQKKYQRVIYQTLQKKVKLKINEEDFAQFGFFIVPNDTLVITNAQKGVVDFIEIYFNGSVLKNDITHDKYYAIISELYKFNVACKIDCESGHLTIYSENSYYK